MDDPLNFNSVYNFDEAEYDGKNYAVRGGCYPNTLVITDVLSQINASCLINTLPPSHHYTFKFAFDAPLWKNEIEQHRSIYSDSWLIKKRFAHCILFSVRFKLRIDYEKSLFFLSPSRETRETRKWPLAWPKPPLFLAFRGFATWRSHASSGEGTELTFFVDLINFLSGIN